MSLKNETTCQFRRWLNNDDNGGSAFVKAHVTTSDYKSHDDTEHKSFDAELVIGDCTRTITLDFSGWVDKRDGNNDLENVRVKVARLRRAVKEFTEAVLEQCDRIESE